MWKRKVSLFHVVDDSLASAKKANGSLNGGNNMTPSIDKWYKKPYFRDSMRLCRRRRLFLYGIKKRSSQADEYPITGNAVSITGYSHQGIDGGKIAQPQRVVKTLDFRMGRGAFKASISFCPYTKKCKLGSSSILS